MDLDVIKTAFKFFVFTLILAFVFGLYVTITDFGGPGYSPENSGRRASMRVYKFFATEPTIDESGFVEELTGYQKIARRMVTPYAWVADFSASVGGTIELGAVSVFHQITEK